MKDTIQKAIEISDAKIQFVSLVDKAANKRQFVFSIFPVDGGEDKLFPIKNLKNQVFRNFIICNHIV